MHNDISFYPFIRKKHCGSKEKLTHFAPVSKSVEMTSCLTITSGYLMSRAVLSPSCNVKSSLPSYTLHCVQSDFVFMKDPMSKLHAP